MAIAHIKAVDGIDYCRKAKYYKTKAWGKTDQNNFLNTVIEIKTSITARKLLKRFQEIEIQMGRVKKEKWGERNIDIDILTYANETQNHEELVIPHPYITQRSFVLMPLLELNPNLSLPKLGRLSQFCNLEKNSNEIMAVFE